MPRVKTLPFDVEKRYIETAAKLREEKYSWEAIARRLGKSPGWIRSRLEPGYKEKRAAWNQIASNSHDIKGIHPNELGWPMSNQELKEHLELIPEDTRDNTGRILGDPIPNDPRRYWLD